MHFPGGNNLFPVPQAQAPYRMPSPGRVSPAPQDSRLEGERVHLSGNMPLPGPGGRGVPPCFDRGGEPMYFGSAHVDQDHTVHPCKIGDHLYPKALVPYGGKEVGVHGRYSLLVYNPETMELVHASGGRLPEGRFLIAGGYDQHGNKMYHAIASINGVRVPGKIGTNDTGALVAFGGQEQLVGNYEVLCWRNNATANESSLEGERVHLSGNIPLPAQRGIAPCYDTGYGRGGEPMYFGSAYLDVDNTVHPCKIGDHLYPKALVAYGGKEVGHQGRYTLLLFNPGTMELVHASGGRTPAGRYPICGGYDQFGDKMYHAVAMINGVRVPGKVGKNIAGALVPFGGLEQLVSDYEILCWR